MNKNNRKTMKIYDFMDVIFRSFGNQYQSWSYYNDNFGIYDDDPEIVTLTKADFGMLFLAIYE